MKLSRYMFLIYWSRMCYYILDCWPDRWSCYIYTESTPCKSPSLLLHHSHIIDCPTILYYPIIHLDRIEEHIEYIRFDPDIHSDEITTQSSNISTRTEYIHVISTDISIRCDVMIARDDDTTMWVESIEDSMSKSLDSDLQYITTRISIYSMRLSS